MDLDDAGRRELPILGRSVNFDLLSGPIENYFGRGGRKADGGVLVGGNSRCQGGQNAQTQRSGAKR